MGRDDWFRSSTWTKDDEELFYKKLSRQRSSSQKSQSLRIKAYHLIDTYPDVADQLLDTLINDYPSEFDMAMAYALKAKLATLREDIEKRRYWIQKCEDHQKEFPNVVVNITF
ncbi:MAG: hypothetical protein AAF558_08265 [Verrucomicrobiota bacterium]